MYTDSQVIHIHQWQKSAKLNFAFTIPLELKNQQHTDSGTQLSSNATWDGWERYTVCRSRSRSNWDMDFKHDEENEGGPLATNGLNGC